MEKVKYSIFWKFLIIFILAILVISYIPSKMAGINRTNKKTSEQIQRNKSINIVPVRTQSAFIGDLILSIQTNGISEAYREIEVSLQNNGYVEQCDLYNGKQVRKGDILITLQNEKQKIALSEARSSLIKALIEFGIQVENTDSALIIVKDIFENWNSEKLLSYTDEMSEKLWGTLEAILKGKNRMEVMLVRSGLMDAYNEYRRAFLNYEHTIYRAPFTGVIGEVQVQVGDWLSSNQQVCKIYDLSGIKIQVPILEEEVLKIKEGAPSEVIFSSIPGVVYKGGVKEINPVIDQEKKNQTITIYVDNVAGKIFPGMSCNVRIQTNVLKNRLLVPREAILVRDGKELVFVVRDSTANWCYVKTGARNEKYVEIKSSEFDLQAGEPVIVEGHFSLAHGATVKMVCIDK